MPLQTPQQQAGIMSFYDSPEKGPKVDMKYVLIFIAAFAALVLVFDKLLLLGA